MRLADRIATGVWRDELLQMETLWRDAATPTIAQSADAAVKKRQQGITPLRQTREDLGYTDVQIERMEAEDELEDRRAARQLGELVQEKPLAEPNGERVPLPMAS